MADDSDIPVLTGGRRKTIDRITKQMKSDLIKLQHKLSDKSNKSDDRESLKKHDKNKMMKYLWKDIKHQNNRNLHGMLSSGVVHLSDLDQTGSLLLYATTRLMKETTRILLENGSLVCCDKANGLSPVHIAVKNGSIAILVIMIKNGVSMDEVTLYEKKTCLHLSVRNTNTEMTKYLLESHSEPDVPDIYGCTALHYAVCTENSELVEMLLQYGADINKLDINGWAPLHHAVASGDAHMVKLLIHHKANITAQTNYGKTPLHVACSENNLSVVDVLVDHDTPTNITDVHGKTPIYYSKHRDIISLLQMCSSDEEEHETTHITLQIKSKSLVDLLDPEFVNDEFHSAKTSSLPVLPTQNKMSFGSLVKLIMKSKGRRRSSVVINDIRTRVGSLDMNMFQHDTRCNSIESLQVSELFSPISDLDTIQEDVFEEDEEEHSESTGENTNGHTDNDNLSYSNLPVQNKDIYNTSTTMPNGKLCHRSNAFICKNEQKSLPESIKTSILNHVDDCLINITNVIEQLDDLRNTRNNMKQHHKLDGLQSYIYGWRNNTENFKQDIVHSFETSS